MKRTYKLVSDSVKAHCIEQIRAAPFGKVVVIQNAVRSLEQNAKFHAMLSDISRQAEYMGKRRTVEFWKGLFVSGWQIATDQKPEIIAGLEGEFINIRESTATMNASKLSGVIEYVQAWASMNGIKFSAAEWEDYSF